MNDILKLQVSPRAWSETEKAWYILSISGPGEMTFNKGFWYPKNICKYENGIIEVPRWFYNRIFGHLEEKPKLIN